jgi:hypothetical protein
VRLSLRYPNGRTHQCDYEGARRFHVGHEFELYGRRWRITDIGRPRGARRDESTRVATCVPLTARRTTFRNVRYESLVRDLASIGDLLEQTKHSDSPTMEETREGLEQTRARMLELLAEFGPPSAS